MVDVIRTHENHGIDWCNLHREMPDATGFYGYNQNKVSKIRNGKQERTALALHPGTRSDGCISVVTSEWSQAKQVIESGTLKYNQTQTFAGILEV